MEEKVSVVVWTDYVKIDWELHLDLVNISSDGREDERLKNWSCLDLWLVFEGDSVIQTLKSQPKIMAYLKQCFKAAEIDPLQQ